MNSTIGVKNFSLGISCCDKNYQNEGQQGWTNFVSAGKSDTGWISDSDHYDPDYYKLSFSKSAMTLQPDIDFRIGVQMCDKDYSQQGPIRYTGWASEGGGWSAYASDSDNYDPDYIKILIDTRNKPGFLVSDVRFGIQVSDGRTSHSDPGPMVYTPWVNESPATIGDTGWVSDGDKYDPDSVRIYLGVR